MAELKILLPITLLILYQVLLVWLRKPGKGGTIGRKIRSSDRWSWEQAVADKEKELEALKEVEPK